MKTTLLTLSLLLCFAVANAQTSPRYSSASCNVGKMLNAPEKSLKTNLVKIKKIRSLQLEAIKVTDINSNITEGGLKISGTTGRNYAPTMTAYVDADELSEFISMLDVMINNTAQKTAPQNKVEYKYQSRSGFKMVVYNAKQFLSGSKKWHVSVKLIEKMPLSEYLFPADDLVDFRNAAIQAKELLDYQILNAAK